MKLLLVRHAAAVPRGAAEVSDDDRPLTPEGVKKFRKAAKGLARITPAPDVLLTSPLPRARATAEIAARAFGRVEPEIEPALVHGSVDKIIAMLDKHPRGATVAIVGHEPELSAVLGRLLGVPHAEGFAFKKGGAALVDLADGPSGSGLLIWFLKPKILRTLAEG